MVVQGDPKHGGDPYHLPHGPFRPDHPKRLAVRTPEADHTGEIVNGPDLAPGPLLTIGPARSLYPHHVLGDFQAYLAHPERGDQADQHRDHERYNGLTRLASRKLDTRKGNEHGEQRPIGDHHAKPPHPRP